jgi:hypothetical protein
VCSSDLNQLSSLQFARKDLLDVIARAEERLSELKNYKSAVESELNRIGRLESSVKYLRPLKVTNCPVCDQPVAQRDFSDRTCYLCHQEILGEPEDANSGEKRVAFEVEQLQGELKEADELINTLGKELKDRQSGLFSTERQLDEIRSRLRPIQQSAAMILPPEIALLDMERGRLIERRQQLQRVNKALGKRAALNNEITAIEARIAALEAENAKQRQGVDLETASDTLADGINSYLNIIKRLRPGSWGDSQVRLHVERREFKFRIGNQSLTVLGGTLSLYFFLAYQYALMSLSRQPTSNYPGFLMLDYPAAMEGTSVADKENFTLQPFIDLLQPPEMSNAQVIAAGSAFENLEPVNRIELCHVWTPV